MPKAKSFSQRAGFTSPRTAIQIGSLDKATLTALWNCFYKYFLNDFSRHQFFSSDYEFGKTYSALWTDFFSLPVDELEHNAYAAISSLHRYFFSNSWYEVFDLLEFVLANYSFPSQIILFSDAANKVLEQELSGYRLVNKLFASVTSEEEIGAIEAAFHSTDTLEPVRLHLYDALAKLSDRKNPDFRNSIKESISGVEALSRIISGQSKATLGDALSAIEIQGKIPIHRALKSGFSSIYGWTSDAQGIRHALLDEPTLTFDDAKFMLVSCSAFVSYLIAKCAAVGLNIQAHK